MNEVIILETYSKIANTKMRLFVVQEKTPCFLVQTQMKSFCKAGLDCCYRLLDRVDHVIKNFLSPPLVPKIHLSG